MIDVRIALFAIVMLSGVVADMLMERELTVLTRVRIVVEWALISLAAVAVTPAQLAPYAALLAGVIGGGRVVAWGARALVAWLRVWLAVRKMQRRWVARGGD